MAEYTKFICGCRVSISEGKGVIEYCSKHKASEDMYEALLSALGSLIALNIKKRSWAQEILDKIQLALVKASGK